MTIIYYSDSILLRFKKAINFKSKNKGEFKYEKLEIIIRPEKLEILKDILTDCGITGMMVSNIMGFGNQMGYTQQYRGTKYSVNLVSKLRIETVVKDEVVDQMIKEIQPNFHLVNVGDGKVFVYPVEQAVRIRTGETGENAL